MNVFGVLFVVGATGILIPLYARIATLTLEAIRERDLVSLAAVALLMMTVVGAIGLTFG